MVAGSNPAEGATWYNVLVINYSSDFLINEIKNVEINKTAVYLKNFIDKDHLPKWAEILNSMYEVANNDFDEELNSYLNKDIEYLIGELIVHKDLYFNFKSNKNIVKKYFKIVPLMLEELQSLLQINQHPFGFYGPKISLGNYYAGFHKDNWNGAALQCEGKAIWRLVDENGTLNQYVLEPGDFVFFHKSLYHEISVEGPRATLLFNSNGIWYN